MSDGDPRSGIKETLTSIIISFALAFVFRGVVIEAFQIPTGSMAPALMGAHMRFTNPRTGYSWPAGARDRESHSQETYLARQGTAAAPIEVIDPMTRETLSREVGVQRRSGDRIFVMKYLYSVYDPERFDVVVFKCPYDPQTNFIKRLVGLPGEQVALVDGDVFVRTPQPTDVGAGVQNAWMLPGWRIARKPERAQRATWQLVFSSEFAPQESADGRAFRSPWIGREAGWDFSESTRYAFTGEGEATLEWNSEQRPIKDYYAYDVAEAPTKHNRFAVGDLALAVGLRPERSGLVVAGVIVACGHEFRAEVAGKDVTLSMRSTAHDVLAGAPREWTTIGRGSIEKPLEPDVTTNLEVWHCDQTLQVWVEGKLVASAAYDWSPDERLKNATTLGDRWATAAMEGARDALANEQHYRGSGARLEFRGGSFSLRRVALSRDIFYQPGMHDKLREPRTRRPIPALTTHPDTTLTLTGDQFFVCGDNSPASLDARLWDNVDPWVAQIDPTLGVVHRHLLIGKAFFVYFPAPGWRGMIPIPDFGRMRFIW